MEHDIINYSDSLAVWYISCIYQGIGDSGQGAANAILFVIFTHNVRQRYISFWYRCFYKKSNAEEQEQLIVNEAKDLTASRGSYKAISPSSPSDPMHIGHSEVVLKGKSVAMTPKSYDSSTSSDSMCDSDYA